MNYLQAIITAIVEGVTEFLPVSSTGHMILTSYLLGLGEDEFTKTFEVFIQLGAILAIVAVYAKRLLKNPRVYDKILIAFLPSAILGFLFYEIIKTYFFNHWVVAISLIVGGVVLIIVDKYLPNHQDKNFQMENTSYRSAMIIGLFQTISMVPGVSRAAITIIGGMIGGMTKKGAAEFSFLLAIPTMLAATGYDLYRYEGTISAHQWSLLAIGFGISFITAIFAVKWFVKFLENRGFAFFGYYRIIVGLLFILITNLR